jgi:hypothetical protein
MCWACTIDLLQRKLDLALEGLKKIEGTVPNPEPSPDRLATYSDWWRGFYSARHADVKLAREAREEIEKLN